MAHKNERVAEAICQAVKDIDPQLHLYVMEKGVIGTIAKAKGIATSYELYSDLAYDDDGNLVITRTHEAHDPERVALRVQRMVLDKQVTSINGKDIAINGSSVCVHSDSPGALEIVKAVRLALEKSDCKICSPER